MKWKEKSASNKWENVLFKVQSTCSSNDANQTNNFDENKLDFIYDFADKKIIKSIISETMLNQIIEDYKKKLLDVKSILVKSMKTKKYISVYIITVFIMKILFCMFFRHTYLKI